MCWKTRIHKRMYNISVIIKYYKTLMKLQWNHCTQCVCEVGYFICWILESTTFKRLVDDMTHETENRPPWSKFAMECDDKYFSHCSGNNANTVFHPPLAMMSLFRSYGYSVTICGSVKDFIRKCASQGKCLRSYLKIRRTNDRKKGTRKWQCRQKL